MSKKIRLVIYAVLFVILLLNIGYKFYNRNQLSELPYGTKANALRLKLRIPIIEEDLTPKYDFHEYKGNQWNSDREFPQKDEILHAWKSVIPGDDFVLNEETDAFRKYINDSLCQQLILKSTIDSDKKVTQVGTTFYLKGQSFKTIDTNKITHDSLAIRSILSDWGL